MRVDPGMSVSSLDGRFGKVASIIVDRRRQRVTHLLVQPHTWFEGIHLIAVDIAVINHDRIDLAQSTAELMRTPVVDRTDLLEPQTWPHPGDGWDVGVTRKFGLPYYPASDGPGFEIWSQRGIDDFCSGEGDATITYDVIPEGTAELRRASVVVSNDGHRLGHVAGLLVDPDYRITHLVVTRVHHLPRHLGLTIPIAELASIETDLVRVRTADGTLDAFPFGPRP